MKRFPASIVSGTAVIPSTGFASGVWSREQQIQARQQGIWPIDPSLVDPYFDYVSMLLHGNGTDTAQNNTFVDSSVNNFAVTRSGNTTQGSFSPYGNLWSNYFDGTGDYLIPTANAAFALGTGDFTIEGWIMPNSASAAQGIIGCGPASTGTWNVFVNFPSNAGKVTFSVYGGTSYTSSGSFTAGTWNHFAIVRNSGTIYVYLNGFGNVGVSSVTDFTVTNMVIGRPYYNLSQEHFQGSISNIRVVKSAVYTANFTPPSGPLSSISNTVLLTCQSNRLIDNSPTNATITKNGDVAVSRFSPFNPSSGYSTANIGGSASFDGTGDALSISTGSSVAFGTGDFTVEFWLYFIVADVDYDVLVAASTMSVGFYQAQNWGFTYNNGIGGFPAAYKIQSGVTVPYSTWAHIACSRVSGVTRLFVNGVQAGGSYTDTTNYASGNTSIGDTFYSPNANISNVRILKGTGLYSSNFTPPTAPLTAITNTSLLLSMTNGAVFDNAMLNNLETVGTAQISTAQSKFGGGSILFQGAGNRLATRANQSQFVFGAGDFTVEAWVYKLATGSGTILAGQGDNASVAGSSYVFYVSGTSTSDLYVGSTAYSATSPNPGTNQWAHVAYVRNGTSYKTYLNGIQVGSVTLPAGATVNVGATTFGPTIGTTGANANTLAGYIDELRVTKGYARYTANFTPPTAPFPNQ